MRTISEDIKNALKQPTTQRKGRILVNNNYYEVYNVEYYADSYEEGNVIGNAIASQLDFDIPYIEKFDSFKYFDGVWTGTEYEYIDMGTFHVFDEQDEDEFNKHITAFDNLLKFNVPFEDVGGYPKTLFEELQNICNQAGVVLNNNNIPNRNFRVVNNQFTNGESLKTVLKSICAISGTYATIKNDRVVLQLKNQTDESLTKEQHEPVVWKRKTYGINQVVLGSSDIEGEYVLREDKNDIAENGVHKLVINDNLFAYTQSKREELIDDLFNQVKGFSYIPYELNGEWLNYMEIGDTITIDGVETIILRINGKSPKSLESTMSAPAIIDSSLEYVDNTNSIKNRTQKAERSVDKQNLIIQDVVEQTDEQNQKIAKVTQTVDELNSKISDIADITTSNESNFGKIDLSNINQSEPIRIQIRPIGENISYLYPNSNLYPSDTLFPKVRTVRFENIKTKEIFDYALPDDLFYYDEENFDEFILDYDGQSIVINKRVGLNDDGTTYILDNPTTIEYEYPRILLTDGDYTVSLLGYDNAYIFVRLMAQNIYTTQFATKAELNSEITQTANSIISEVTGKIDTIDDELSAKLELKVDTNKLISEINASADVINLTSNRLIIDSNNFKLTADGKITSTSGKIGGYDIGTTNLSAEVGKKLSFPLDNQTDFQTAYNKIYNHVYNIELLTGNELKKYDINEDGIIDKIDLLMLNRIYYGYAIIEGNFSINSGEYENILSFKDLNGNVTTGIDLDSITTPYLSAKSTFSCPGSATIDTLEITGTFTNNSDKRLKKDIKELNNEYINIVKNTRPVEFTYKKDNTRHIGFIAQELEKSFKENKIKEIPIKKDELGIYSIDYISLIGILWKSNQDLYKRIESLEKLLKESEN